MQYRHVQNLPCQVPPHRIVSYRIESHRITSYRIASHHIASHRVTSHHIASYRTTSHHIASHRIVPPPSLTKPKFWTRWRAPGSSPFSLHSSLFENQRKTTITNLPAIGIGTKAATLKESAATSRQIEKMYHRYHHCGV